MKINDALSNNSCVLGELGFDSDEVHLDIGCARGTFIFEAATQNPNFAYIGIEVNSKAFEDLKSLWKSHGLKNVYIVKAEGFDFLKNRIADHSVHGIHVYFPTPYFRSLQKLEDVEFPIISRLITTSFFRECMRSLSPGGLIRIASDHRAYVKDIIKYAKQVGLISLPWEDHIFPRNNRVIIGTGCEKSRLKAGEPTQTLMFI